MLDAAADEYGNARIPWIGIRYPVIGYVINTVDGSREPWHTGEHNYVFEVEIEEDE